MTAPNLKHYVLTDITTNEQRVVLLDDKHWTKGYTLDEVQRLIDYLKDNL